MEINVRISLDATPAMTDLVGKVCEAFGYGAVPLSPVAANSVYPEPWTEDVAAPAATEAPAPAATEEPAPINAAQEAPAPAAPVYTDQCLRDAMNATRRRLLGEDWDKGEDKGKGNPLFKPLNAEFRNIARMLGASLPEEERVDINSPIDLPMTEIRVAFVRSCDEITVEDGKIVAGLPF